MTIESRSSGLRLTVTVDEAAAALRVSPRTVRNLINSGELKPCRIGRRVLVSVATLEAFVRDHEPEESP